jgi:hypothetical protein
MKEFTTENHNGVELTVSYFILAQPSVTSPWRLLPGKFRTLELAQQLVKHELPKFTSMNYRINKLLEGSTLVDEGSSISTGTVEHGVSEEMPEILRTP